MIFFGCQDGEIFYKGIVDSDSDEDFDVRTMREASSRFL